MTILEFASQIESEYGPKTAESFRRHYQGKPQEIDINDALGVLDSILLGSSKPNVPEPFQTDSRNDGGEVVFRD